MHVKHDNYVLYPKRHGILNPQGSERPTTDNYFCEDCKRAFITKYGIDRCIYCNSAQIQTEKEREPPLIVAYLNDKYLGK